ncbi:hypothetical protein D4N35_017725 [Siminovitchia fortis]|uniref:Uncharacterized protein n=1 Tax=Siminovitchia fortis TaxID=254758 RepID=A0A443IIR8_9BACI|nr:hypothetical protein D4N35_017725 [Siminovitchia fortis]
MGLNQSRKQSVSYVCLTCHEKEEIRLSVVRDFDLMDDGDPTTPPMFSWEQCGGEMYPEYYKGVHGMEYKLSDIL